MSNSILLQTLQGKQTERPPMWFMRQAGRVLPNYLKLKEKHSFWQMMQDPKLAAKVTLMPIQDLGVDAAILFSDILVIPYAMGMGLDFTDKGPVFNQPLAQRNDVLTALHPDPSKLQYIYNAIDEIVKQKPKHIPLIGFCGAPLTVLLYMLQGLSSKREFPEAIEFIYKHKETTKALIDRITELSIIYAKEQIKHGVQVFQLFDTHAGILPFSMYEKLFLPSVKKIAKAVREENIPFIFFPKGIGTGIEKISPEYADFLSIDWQTDLYSARNIVHREVGLQGNIDPRILYAEQTEIENILSGYLKFGAENQNWIVNFGHGFMPGLSYNKAKYMIEWLKNADWKR